MVAFIGELRPDILVWYHQDAYMIGPAEGRDGAVRARYAELTGLPMESVTGGTYTGVAAQWARNELAGTRVSPVWHSSSSSVRPCRLRKPTCMPRRS